MTLSTAQLPLLDRVRLPCSSREAYADPGLAVQYQASRPRPPLALLDLLCEGARAERPHLIVALGCGAGLSTAIWSSRADAVIGLDAEQAMPAVARQWITLPNVALRVGLTHATGLLTASADITTCCRSFQRMESHATPNDVARLLRPGGVFAAVRNDMPVDWKVERADVRFPVTTRRLLQEHALEGRSGKQRCWPNEDRRDWLRTSGHGVSVREVLLHAVEPGTADRAVRQAVEVLAAPGGTLQALRPPASPMGNSVRLSGKI
jgi:trans-aconitate methyltransferase